MATTINLIRRNTIKKGFVGFSWTVLFFGFLVPLFRGDWKSMFLLLLLQVLSCNIAGIISAFMYNKIYTRKLLEEEGYYPADPYSRQVLNSAGIRFYE